MKTFFLGMDPEVMESGSKLDNLSQITHQNWVMINDSPDQKETYIFRKYHNLLISKNGLVEAARWEYLNADNLLIYTSNGSFLFHPSLLDPDILGMKIDGRDEYTVLVNENRYEREFNSIHSVIKFLGDKYKNPAPPPKFPHVKLFDKADKGILMFLLGAAAVTLAILVALYVSNLS